MISSENVNGKPTLGIRLNFNKRYITLAPVSTLIGLACKLYDPDHLIGPADDLGITVVLLPSDTPGVETGDRHIPMNIPFQNGPVRGKDVFVHKSALAGETLQEGQKVSFDTEMTPKGVAAINVTAA